LSNLRRPSLVALSLALLSACASRTPGPCGPCGSPAPGTLDVAPPRPPKMRELAARRVDLARKRLVLLRGSFDQGKATLDEVFAAFRDFALAARDSGLEGAGLRDVLTEYRDGVTALRDLTRERLSKGAVAEEALLRVESLVAEAELWLEEASQGR